MKKKPSPPVQIVSAHPAPKSTSLKPTISSIVEEELMRVVFHTVFWGICAGLAFVAFKQGWITKDSAIPAAIEHYIDEKINSLVYLFEFLIMAATTGVFALFGAPKMVKIAQEEVSRILYTIGTFVGWFILLAAAVNLVTTKHYFVGVFIWFGYCLFGIMFAVFTQRR